MRCDSGGVRNSSLSAAGTSLWRVGSRQPVVESVGARPSPALARLVGRYVGYRIDGFPPGTHLGLPSASLTIVISLGAPTDIRTWHDGYTGTASFPALVGGLHTKPAEIVHDGRQHGVQLALTPAGARALLGMPAGELGATVVALDEVFPATAELTGRMAAAPGWRGRFAVLEDVLVGALGRGSALPEGPLTHAWNRIVGSGGRARVDDVAREVGWSRRHLGQRFRREYGLSPKDAVRVSRFDSSRRLVERPDRPTLAEVAAISGYADQSHLAREWNDLAGRPPSAWIADEEFPFVQDEAGEPVAA